MDKSKQIINIVRERLGNKPTYNPVEFLEMCAAVRDELETAEQCVHVDECPRCGGSKRVCNDGFVWVVCPACSGIRQ